MAAFQFRNYNRDVDICGCKYKLYCGAETGDFLKKLSEDMRDVSKKLSTGEKTNADALSLMQKAINKLLGDGACEKIFAGRETNVTDCSDLLLYLADTVTQTFKASQVRAEIKHK